MNSRLILLLDEHWPHRDPSADWVLLDGAGRVQQQGRSAPAHWPSAPTTCAVLGGSQTLWLEVPLPPAPRRDRPRLLAYALEEHLLGDPDGQHLTVTHSESDGEVRRTGVLAVSRARMNQLIAQFEALGRPLHHLRSILEIVPVCGNGPVLACGPGTQCVLRTGTHSAIALDVPLGDVPCAGVSVALRTAIGPLAFSVDGKSVDVKSLDLRIHVGAEGGDSLGAVLTSALQVPVTCGPSWTWWERFNAANELLHGEFQSTHCQSRILRRLKVPAVLGAVAAATFIVLSLIQVALMRAELNEVDTRIERVFTDALPATPAIDPLRQLVRALDQARHRHGQLATDDLLTLLQAHLQATGLAPVALDYEDRALGLRFAAEHGARVSGLIPMLAMHGLDARFENGVLSIRTAPQLGARR